MILADDATPKPDGIFGKDTRKRFPLAREQTFAAVLTARKKDES